MKQVWVYLLVQGREWWEVRRVKVEHSISNKVTFRFPRVTTGTWINGSTAQERVSEEMPYRSYSLFKFI